jgi:bifunctional DNA-binding transcriptional regulator/antitoxin component of YhaV-PrlF toxin-antitoxin module
MPSLKIRADNSLVIPKAILQAHGLNAGMEVDYIEDETGLHILSQDKNAAISNLRKNLFTGRETSLEALSGALKSPYTEPLNSAEMDKFLGEAALERFEKSKQP